MRCLFSEGKPTGATIAWFKDGVELPGRTTDRFGITLTKEDDFKPLKCRVSNSLGFRDSEELVLQVYCELLAPLPSCLGLKKPNIIRPPLFSDRPENIELLGYEGPYSVGDSLTLTCSFVDGKPPVDISWTRDGVRLQGETGRTLVLGPLTENDNGSVVSCRVSNAVISTPSDGILIEVQ